MTKIWKMDKYSEVEQEAIKWLSETDTMQFSTMELLAMFAEHWKVKSSLVDVRQQRESLITFLMKVGDCYGMEKRENAEICVDEILSN